MGFQRQRFLEIPRAEGAAGFISRQWDCSGTLRDLQQTHRLEGHKMPKADITWFCFSGDFLSLGPYIFEPFGDDFFFSRLLEGKSKIR